MQGHEPGATERKHPEGPWETMTTITATRPHFACYDVVLTLGVGGPHNELVDDLRRAAWSRTTADSESTARSRLSTWLRQVTGSH